MAKQEDGKPRAGLNVMDIDVRRNAYGRQLGSFNAKGEVKGIAPDFPMTFIRAPYIHRALSPDVEILSTVDDHIVAAQQGNILATAFHPELDTPLLHQWWCKEVVQ